MRKRLQTVGLLLLQIIGVLMLPANAFAQNTMCPPGNYQALCSLKLGGNQAGGVVQIIIIIAVAVSLIMMIFGGIKWITSGGDRGKVTQARSTIIAAVVGLVISILAYAIVNYVVFAFAKTNINSLQVPALY